MNSPKIWLALAAAAILGLVFYLGKLQERSVNAPAIAAATKYTSALEGEKKELERQVQSFNLKETTWALKLRDSELKRQDLAKKVDRIPMLLGLDGRGKGIVAYRSTETTVSATSTESAHAVDTQLQAREEAAKAEASRLLANRKASCLWYSGLGLQADRWNSLDGWMGGAPAAALGVQLQPFMLSGRKVFDGSDHLEAELGFSW